jgi:hypothetical protein
MTPNTLIERLRGLIRVPVNDGAGLLDDKDFFERQFPASRIALEAAARIEALEAALRLARARIEYLGTVCPGPTHYDANARTFLPMIDVVLDVQTTPPSKD